MKRHILLALLLTSGCAAVLTYKTINFEQLYGRSAPVNRQLTPKEASLSDQQKRVSFYKDVMPILESRCVACHGCYDAPCQLKLGSIEGLDRGASKQPVYDTSRLTTANPTRLFTDATTTQGWREMGFFPVLNERQNSAVANLDNSILAKLIALKRVNPLPASGKLGKDFDLQFGRMHQCPRVEEFPKFQEEHPKWGMPYAMPGLTLKEEHTILQWLEEGAKVAPPAPVSKQALAAIAKWEGYFNGVSLKQQLVARYLYEHLFIGHMHFKGHADREFFQWVRSRTPAGQPIEEIVSVRPYDDPGTGKFYYRLRPVTETIVDKTHFVYELSDQKMQRYNELFFQPDYEVTELPSYQPKVAANPLRAFMSLPYVSRHKFLLDDSWYFASGFIKGPVCRGEVATDAIRDRFWVVFVQPGRFPTKDVLKAVAENADLLALPGEEEENIGLFGWSKYDELGKEYLKKKEEFISRVMPKDEGFGISNIWDGEGRNPNAALTIFRHLNSSTVVQGFVGDVPLTSWVMDYPIFERLHYLLVAGYNVYGKAQHQIATRSYMDLLRQDAEDNFLRFMPAQQRGAIYRSWYMGLKSPRKADAYFSIAHETDVKYQTTDYKKEFFEQVRQHLGKAAGAQDLINFCQHEPCNRPGTSAVQQQVDRQLRELSKLQGHGVSALPEMALLRVTTGKPANDLVYTLIVDRAYANITSMISQNASRMPEKDRLTIFPGFIGAYPNFFFRVELNQVDEFVQRLQQARSGEDMELVFSTFGVRRTNPDIWGDVDWFNDQHRKYRGIEAGLLDMNRYDDL